MQYLLSCEVLPRNYSNEFCRKRYKNMFDFLKKCFKKNFTKTTENPNEISEMVMPCGN